MVRVNAPMKIAIMVRMVLSLLRKVFPMAVFITSMVFMFFLLS